MASTQRWSFGVWFKELQEKGRDWVTQMENLEGIKETKQLEQFHFTTFTVPVQCPVQSRMLPPELQYNTSFLQQPKSGPFLQCTPEILMLGHFRTHQKPSQVLTLSAGMVPDVQTMARSGSQSLRLSPHHKTLCCVWTEPGKGERCQLPPEGKAQQNTTQKPSAQWKAGTLQESVSKQRRYGMFFLCTQY